MSPDDTRRAPVSRVRITDPEELQRVLQVLSDHFGGKSQAAAALGMVHSTFGRLLSGQTKHQMSVKTYQQIRDALSGHVIEFGLIDLFEGTVETEDFGFYTHRYQSWLDRELSRLKELADPTLRQLWTQQKYRAVIGRHLQNATGSESLPLPDQGRQWLALYRAIEPLTKSDDTWGVERSWQQLSENDQLRAYLRHALSCERLLLDREGDVERMGKNPPPEEFFAQLAGVFDEEDQTVPSAPILEEILSLLEEDATDSQSE